MTEFGRARVLSAVWLLLAAGIPASAIAIASGRTKLTPAQLAQMSLCSDQQSGASAGPDACRPFVAGGRPGVRTVLSDVQKDRMAECIDESQGHGTIGPGSAAIGDVCAEFVPPRHTKR